MLTKIVIGIESHRFLNQNVYVRFNFQLNYYKLSGKSKDNKRKDIKKIVQRDA